MADVSRDLGEEWREWEDSVLLLEANKPKNKPPPLYSWPLLIIGVVAVSSAGVVFQSMPEVPAINLAAWRLQLTSVLLAPGAVVEWRRMSTDKCQETKRSFWVLLASGACLAVHFGCFVWGVHNTSLPHSLLLLSTTPIVLTVGSFCLRKPISNGEILGTLLGVIASLTLAIGSEHSKDDEATVKGDLASLAAAVAIAGYLSAGSKLREWMPLFVYALPVTAIAALLLMLSALVVDHTRLFAAGELGLFGWMTSKYWLRVVWLAVGPGVLGHTVFNTLLKWMSPLVIALACMMEPLVGTLLGFSLGVSDGPRPATWAGGTVMLIALITVTLSGHKRLKRLQAKQEASLALSRVFAEEEEEDAALVTGRGGTSAAPRQPWPRDLVRSPPGEGGSDRGPAHTSVWASIEALSAGSPGSSMRPNGTASAV